MKYLVLLLIPFTVLADRWHHGQDIILQVEPIINIEQPQVDTLAQQPVDLSVNTLYDECQGVPIAMAAANNQMYMGTDNLQVSGGMGTCGSNWAGSLMAGMRVRNNLMINGNWAFDERVNAFGFGATWIFK